MQLEVGPEDAGPSRSTQLRDWRCQRELSNRALPSSGRCFLLPRFARTAPWPNGTHRRHPGSLCAGHLDVVVRRPIKAMGHESGYFPESGLTPAFLDLRS